MLTTSTVLGHSEVKYIHINGWPERLHWLNTAYNSQTHLAPYTILCRCRHFRKIIKVIVSLFSPGTLPWCWSPVFLFPVPGRLSLGIHPRHNSEICRIKIAEKHLHEMFNSYSILPHNKSPSLLLWIQQQGWIVEWLTENMYTYILTTQNAVLWKALNKIINSAQENQQEDQSILISCLYKIHESFVHPSSSFKVWSTITQARHVQLIVSCYFK